MIFVMAGTTVALRETIPAMQRASRGWRWHPVIGLALIVSGALAIRGYTQRATVSGPVNNYVNAAVCGQCHAGIASTFRKTGMGRSFYRLNSQNVIEDFKPGKPFYHEASDSYFSMIERGG